MTNVPQHDNVFILNVSATPYIYTLSLHDALPIWGEEVVDVSFVNVEPGTESAVDVTLLGPLPVPAQMLQVRIRLEQHPELGHVRQALARAHPHGDDDFAVAVHVVFHGAAAFRGRGQGVGIRDRDAALPLLAGGVAERLLPMDIPAGLEPGTVSRGGAPRPFVRGGRVPEVRRRARAEQLPAPGSGGDESVGLHLQI